MLFFMWLFKYYKLLIRIICKTVENMKIFTFILQHISHLQNVPDVKTVFSFFYPGSVTDLSCQLLGDRKRGIQDAKNSK